MKSTAYSKIASKIKLVTAQLKKLKDQFKTAKADEKSKKGNAKLTRKLKRKPKSTKSKKITRARHSQPQASE